MSWSKHPSKSTNTCLMFTLELYSKPPNHTCFHAIIIIWLTIVTWPGLGFRCLYNVYHWLKLHRQTDRQNTIMTSFTSWCSLTCSCSCFKNSNSSSRVCLLFSASMWASVSLSRSWKHQNYQLWRQWADDQKANRTRYHVNNINPIRKINIRCLPLNARYDYIYWQLTFQLMELITLFVNHYNEVIMKYIMLFLATKSPPPLYFGW